MELAANTHRVYAQHTRLDWPTCYFAVTEISDVLEILNGVYPQS